MEREGSNIAYDEAFLNDRAGFMHRLLTPDRFVDAEVYESIGDIQVRSERYSCRMDMPGAPCNIEGYRNTIIRDGVEIDSFTSIDEESKWWMIDHRDGNAYLVYTWDLYGYGVLNLSTRDRFVCMPAAAHAGDETFIWVDVHYNATNSVLAIDGCHWACPFSVVLMDFAAPLQENAQVDVNRFLPFDTYTDIGFCEWKGTDLTIERRGGIAPTKPDERVVIGKDEYMRWLARR